MAVLRYRLDDLGWQLFEAVCQSVLINKYAVGVQAWGGTGDWGRDAFYVGKLPIPDRSHANARRFTFQAKFVEGANASAAKPEVALLTAVKAEIELLVRRGSTPQCYVLMTNVVLSAKLRVKVEALLSAALPATDIVTWGGAELAALLDDLPNVRFSFPQLLSPRDFRALLNEVVHKSTHARSAEMLTRATDEAQVFIPTTSHREAVDTLMKYGMAVLSGLPEMGKTTIAFAIALSRALEGWHYFAVRSAEELLSVHDRDQRQIFVADDAFGSTEYKPGLAEEWATSLESVLRRVDKAHWVIWTTRTGPLKAALQKMHLQGIAEKFPNPGNVIVNAAELTTREKALMLYAHAKAANLALHQRDIVRTNAEVIVKHSFFTPKRVQRFVRETLPTLSRSASLSAAIEHELRAPTDSMRKSFDALPEDHKLFLISALDGPTVVASFERHAHGAHASVTEVEATLLEHFIVRNTSQQYGKKEESIAWAHPSWRDMVIDYVADAPARRTAFLQRCGVEGLALALSTGGGAQGERRLPFLKQGADWDVLEKRLPNLVQQLNADEIPSLLALLNDVTSPSFFGVPEQALRARKWVQLLLVGVRDFWNRTQVPIHHLELFYRLAERSTAYIASPSLRATWEELVREALKELKDPPYYTTFLSVEELWEFCALIQANEPRFLKHIGFPAAYEHVGEEALKEFESYFSGDPTPEYRDEYREELDQMETFEEHLAVIGTTFPNLDERARHLAARASRRRKQYESDLEDGVPSRPERPSKMIHPDLARPQTDERIDIAKLFSDL